MILKLGYSVLDHENHLVHNSEECHILGFFWLFWAGDKSAVLPGGIRIGSPALTTRGFQEQDFIKVADFIHEGIQIGLKAKGSCVGTKLKDFIEYVESKECEQAADIADLRRRVESFASQFPIPGVETANLLQH
jgi:glycine hydroxymethyltransferase